MVRDSTSSQASALLDLYQRSRHLLDVAAATERRSITPSVADLLLWMQDAQRHYTLQYPPPPPPPQVAPRPPDVILSSPFRLVRRKALLQTLRADDLSLLESAPQRWKDLDGPSGGDGIAGERHAGVGGVTSCDVRECVFECVFKCVFKCVS